MFEPARKFLALVVFSLALFSSGFAVAQPQLPSKVAIILGGGKAESPTDIQYQISLKEAAQSRLTLLKKGYRVKVLFGPESQADSKYLKGALGSDFKPLTALNIQGLLVDEVNWIEGTHQKNLKYIVEIATHGQYSKPNEVSHNIALGGLPEKWFSLDYLQPLQQVIEATEGQMLMIDFSCFSGASLHLADQNTCVVTSTNALEAAGAAHDFPDYFFSAFINSLADNDSVESKFLRSRQQAEGFTEVFYNKPEISTLTHQAIKPIVDKYFSDFSVFFMVADPMIVHFMALTRDETMNPLILTEWLSHISPVDRNEMENYIRTRNEFWSRPYLPSLIYEAYNHRFGETEAYSCSLDIDKSSNEIRKACQAPEAYAFIKGHPQMASAVREYNNLQQQAYSYKDKLNKDAERNIYDQTYKSLKKRSHDTGVCSQFYL